MVLARLDGYGAIRGDAIRKVFHGNNVELSLSGAEAATKLIEMRRTSRGDNKDDAYRTGGDVAIPKEQDGREYVHRLQAVAQAEHVDMRMISHVGDGNLHPTFSVGPDEGKSVGTS